MFVNAVLVTELPPKKFLCHFCSSSENHRPSLKFVLFPSHSLFLRRRFVPSNYLCFYLLEKACEQMQAILYIILVDAFLKFR